MHEHLWYFTLATSRWTATCGCGLAVAVEELGPGQSTWRWTRHGQVPPAELILDAIGSVTRARRELLASLLTGSN